jgi:hypothetical protein
MKRARTRYVAVTVFCVSACAGARFDTTDPHSEPPPRRPPGIAVDPVTEWPKPQPRGNSEHGLLVLSAPRSLSEVHAVIDRFFHAMVAETPEEIDLLLSDQAFLESTAGRQPARGALRSRLAQLDYSLLRGVPLYLARDVEVYRAEDARILESLRSLPRELARDQIYARVRLSVAHAGKTRLFSDQVGFLLRANSSGFRIVSINEDTPVP